MAPACSAFNLAKNFPAECQADMNSPIHTMNHGTDIKTLKIAAYRQRSGPQSGP